MHPVFVSAKEFVHRHKKWEPIVFFIAGFAFDATLLHRIDDPLMLTHQAIYLTLCAAIIAWDLFGDIDRAEIPATEEGRIPKFFKKLWSYREGLLHFMLGTLLNVYTIFYFKSGTIISSLLFLGLLASLLFLNEVRPPSIPKHMLRNALFSLCLISYLNVVVSILMRQIGLTVFIVALVAAAAVDFIFSYILKRKLDPAKIRFQVQGPFWVMVVIYIILYATKVLPPVPMSIKHMGVYHGVSRVTAGYQLEERRPEWKFWEAGDQTFKAAPGDKISVFIQVFSPAHFHDQLFIRWNYHDPVKGWTKADSQPLPIFGGREDGFRGFVTKSNYQMGDWKVYVETSDGRDIGRLALTIEPADPAAPETPRFIVR